ncbi:MAG TPA: methyltransferase domain-containing protein, partial [Herpetosiphonaceae bacterium]
KASQLAVRHVPHKNDVLLFQTASPAAELLELRTVEDVFIVAARIFNIAQAQAGVRQVHAAVKQASTVQAALNAYVAAGGRLSKTVTFRVIARAVGRQEFTRSALGHAVSDAVKDGWPGKWVEVEEGEMVEVWATLFSSELVVALRITDQRMRHRSGQTGGRVVNRPAALRPTIAAAMVRLTNPQADDVFLDPMAGTGTLVAERAAAGPCDRLIAGDSSREAVKALGVNLQAVGGDLAIRRLDAQDLPFADGEISKIAVNLPFGRRVSHPDELNLLYAGAFREWVRVVKPGGLIVALASEVERLRSVLSAIPELRIKAHYTIEVLGHGATIFQIERKRTTR